MSCHKIIIASNKIKMFMEQFACLLAFPEVDINMPDLIFHSAEL